MLEGLKVANLNSSHRVVIALDRLVINLFKMLEQLFERLDIRRTALKISGCKAVNINGSDIADHDGHFNIREGRCDFTLITPYFLDDTSGHNFQRFITPEIRVKTISRSENRR
jgi:hypothetical protein